MRARIADDPDSWGKPADLERKPIAADDSKCPSCGVQWMHHMADLCPILLPESGMRHLSWGAAYQRYLSRLHPVQDLGAIDGGCGG